MLRRIVSVAVSLGLLMTLVAAFGPSASAQDAKKETPKATEPAKTEAPKTETPAVKKEEPKKEEPKKEEPKKEEPKKEEVKKEPAEAPPPSVPPEVEAKLEAARHAVAEAIVAAQDAGLVETSIDPPPILDILIKGYAIDARTLKNTAGKKPYPVSPEVFAAWFTGYGKLEGVNYQNDVRIINPSAGLKQWYDQRASLLNRHIEAVRKAKGPAPKKEEVKKEEPKKEEPKKK